MAQDPMAFYSSLMSMLKAMAILGLILYVYVAFALMTVARKLKEEPAWLAWIPIANLWLMWKVSGTEQWSFWLVLAGFLLGFIPLLGWLLNLTAIVLVFWWMWKLAERLGKPGALSLINLIPVIGPLIYWGIVAWA